MSNLLSRLRDQVVTEFEETPNGASHAQVMIMFALFAVAMFGILGLAIDGGYAFAQRRSVQSAADLAAVAGTRAVVRYKLANPTSAATDVNTVLSGNELGGTTLALKSCRYVTYAGDVWDDSDDIIFREIGNCSSSVPIEATGVTVEVEETHETLFMRLFPGAPAHLTVSASATAYAERTKNAGVDSIFITCGVGSRTVTSLSDTAAPSGTTSILKSDGSGIKINPDAINQTFRIVDSTPNNIARCGATGATWNLWRGLALPGSLNGSPGTGNVPSNKEIGSNWFVKADTTATLPATNNKLDIPGFKGCAAATAAPYNCVLIIPIACDVSMGCAIPSSTNPRTMYVGLSAAFYIQKCGTFCLNGTLIDDYLMADMSYPGNSGPIPWSRDSGGVIGIKLKRLSE